MRAVIQRVQQAAVTIDHRLHAAIKSGLLVFLGIEDSDSDDDIEWLCRKIINLRIFNDHAGVMNLSLLESEGDLMVVSQFTLHALTKKGNRPSYAKASKPEIAMPLYEEFLKMLEEKFEKPVYSGIFGADMKVSIVNDGPVTIFIDTKNKE